MTKVIKEKTYTTHKIVMETHNFRKIIIILRLNHSILNETAINAKRKCYSAKGN